MIVEGNLLIAWTNSSSDNVFSLCSLPEYVYTSPVAFFPSDNIIIDFSSQILDLG